jgi:hypothetical protein
VGAADGVALELALGLETTGSPAVKSGQGPNVATRVPPAKRPKTARRRSMFDERVRRDRREETRRGLVI